jgi:hypothetical protein
MTGRPAEPVELTAMISVENNRSRTSSAVGLNTRGSESQCDLHQSWTTR